MTCHAACGHHQLHFRGCAPKDGEMEPASGKAEPWPWVSQLSTQGPPRAPMVTRAGQDAGREGSGDTPTFRTESPCPMELSTVGTNTSTSEKKFSVFLINYFNDWGANPPTLPSSCLEETSGNAAPHNAIRNKTKSGQCPPEAWGRGMAVGKGLEAPCPRGGGQGAGTGSRGRQEHLTPLGQPAHPQERILQK